MKRRTGWAVALVLVVATLLRLPGLEKSFSLDEIGVVDAARAPGDRFAPDVRALAGAPPLNYAVLRWVALYGLEEGRLRLPSLISGVAGVAVVAGLAAELFSARTAVVAALFLAVSPLHVAYSQQARFYTPFVALGLALLLLAWRLLTTRQGWCAAAGVATVALYTHYYALLVLGGIALYAIGGAVSGRIEWRRAGRVSAMAGLAITLFGPWMVYDLPAGLGRQLTLSNVGWTTLGSIVGAFADGESAKGQSPLSLALAALATVGVLAGLRGRPGPTVYLLGTMVVGLIGALWTAWWLPYFFVPAQVLFLLPIYLMLAAEGVGALADLIPWSRARDLAAVALTAALTMAAAGPLQRHYAATTSDWRAAARVVLDNLGHEDGVATAAASEPLLFYAPELQRRLRGGRPRAVPSGLTSKTRAWIVAPWSARLHPEWPLVQQFLDWHIVVDLSPSPDPLVYFVTQDIGRERTYVEAASFELPIEVLARQSLVRDLLVEFGPKPELLPLIDRVIAAEGVSLRNPALLQSVTVLYEGGQLERARQLAAKIAGAEPDWLEAQQALIAVNEGQGGGAHGASGKGPVKND